MFTYTKFISALLRFPCAFLTLLWTSFSFLGVYFWEEHSLFFESSFIISIIGFALFILLQLVGETRFSKLYQRMLLQGFGWPLLFVLWLSFPSLPFENWPYCFHFQYGSLFLFLLVSIVVLPSFSAHKESFLWKFGRDIFVRLLLSVLFGGSVIVGALALCLFFGEDEGVSFGLGTAAAILFCGFYLLIAFPRFDRVTSEKEGHPGLRLFVWSALIFLSPLLVGTIGYLTLDIIDHKDLDSALIAGGLSIAFGGVLLYGSAYPVNEGWLRKIFRIFFVLCLPIFVFTGLLVYKDVRIVGVSLFNYLGFTAGLWLFIGGFFIVFHKGRRISFLVKSLFILLIVICVGPLSGLNVSEYFLAKRLKGLYASMADNKGKNQRGSCDNLPWYHDARRTMYLLDMIHGYSLLEEKVPKNSAQAQWLKLRCEGYDILSLLQHIPEELAKSLVMLYSFDSRRRCWAAKKIGKAGNTAIPAVPHLIEMLDVTYMSYSKKLIRLVDRRSFPPPSKAAERALIQIGAPAKPYLIHAYRNRRSGIHGIFLVFASEEIDYGQDVLAAMLRDPLGHVRRITAQFLGHVRCRGNECWAGELLIDGLKDPDPEVRARAAYSLGQLQYLPAVEPLIRSLLDSKNSVKISAIDALARMKSVEAVGMLIELLKSQDNKVQAKASKALHQITRKNYGQNFHEWKEWWNHYFRSHVKSLKPLRFHKIPDKPVIPYLAPKYSKERFPAIVISFDIIEDG